MSYKLFYTSEVAKQIKKLDPSVKKLLKIWIEKHLLNTDNPRLYGKQLVGDKKGLWRYRIGNYRLIVEIKDKQLIIIALSFGHRSSIYR